MPQRDAIFDILDEFDTTGNYEEAYQQIQREYRIYMPTRTTRRRTSRPTRRRRPQKPKKKRTLTAWQKFVKTNSKKKEFRLRGGKVNLKKLGVAYRKKTGKRKGKK